MSKLYLIFVAFVSFSCNNSQEGSVISETSVDKTIIKTVQPIDTSPYYMPNLTFERYDSSEFSFKEVRGKVLLLSYWATWCGSCIKRHPGFEKISDNINTKDFIMINISIDGKKENWEKYLGYHRWKDINLFIGFDQKNPLAKNIIKPFLKNGDTIFRAGIPKYFILDKQLNLKQIKTIDYKKIENDIKLLLK